MRQLKKDYNKQRKNYKHKISKKKSSCKLLVKLMKTKIKSCKKLLRYSKNFKLRKKEEVKKYLKNV